MNLEAFRGSPEPVFYHPTPNHSFPTQTRWQSHTSTRHACPPLVQHDKACCTHDLAPTQYRRSCADPGSNFLVHFAARESSNTQVTVSIATGRRGFAPVRYANTCYHVEHHEARSALHEFRMVLIPAGSSRHHGQDVTGRDGIGLDRTARDMTGHDRAVTLTH